MIRVQMIRSDTHHPDRRRRHQGRASCEVAGRRFEVWDDVSPFGKPGGLAMRGKVRNWARLVKGKPTFGKDAPCETDFSSGERDMVAQAAGRVTETDSPRPENARTARSHPLDGPEHPQGQDDASTGVVGPQTPVAA